jgi:hypothetical protein
VWVAASIPTSNIHYFPGSGDWLQPVGLELGYIRKIKKFLNMEHLGSKLLIVTSFIQPEINPLPG